MLTTINIQKNIMMRISRAAKKINTSQSKLIVSLLKDVMNDAEKPVLLGTLVRYQERNAGAEWHTFHISLREDEYEYFLDLRKLLKMSVSLILAFAVNKYLKDKSIKRIIDKNLIQNYIIIKKNINDIICWKFIWGYSGDIVKEL